MVSIIIPLYNKANCIKKTLDSILAQSFQDFEIIIVNDGSTDNSVNIVASFKDSRIRLFSKNNGGVSSARNYGISHAQYKLICFCDADDTWDIDYLQTIINLQNKYPECGMYATAYRKISPNGTIKIVSIGNKTTDFIITDLCDKKNIYNIQTSAICVKKEIFKTLTGFKEGVKTGEDLDMWLRIACKYTIAYYNQPKTSYFLETENNTFKTKVKFRFPYWTWYNYPYPNKKSLYLLTNKRIANTIKDAFLEKKFIFAFKILCKMRNVFPFIICQILKYLNIWNR